jgi:hypothetical protein
MPMRIHERSARNNGRLRQAPSDGI